MEPENLCIKIQNGIYIEFFHLTNDFIFINNIFINKRPINNNQMKYKYIKAYSKFLRLSNYFINIKISHKKQKINLHKILNIGLDKYLKKREALSRERKLDLNDIKTKKINIQENMKKTEPKKKLSYLFCFLLIGFIILILTFIFDYENIKIKANSDNIKKINDLQSKYSTNKCSENKNLPALKEYCSELEKEIELIKLKAPSNLSIFVIWIFDIFNSSYKTIGYLNFYLTLIIILILIKIIF